MQGFWTPEKVEILRRQWAAGTSVRAIAVRLGGSRNAVIGKAYRLDLPTHAASTRHPDARHTMKKPRTKPRMARRGRPRKLPVPLPPLAEPLRIAFADLEHHHCRYPVSAQPPHVFCGHARNGKSPFCLLHHALCHEGPRQKSEAPPQTKPGAAGFNYAFRYGRVA